MKFTDIQKFVIKHAGEQWFETDKQLFIRLMPKSKLIAEIEKVNKYNKKQLDERMIIELLQRPNGCDCEILENRGFTPDRFGKLIPIRKPAEMPKPEVKTIETPPTPIPVINKEQNKPVANNKKKVRPAKSTHK